MNAVPPDRALMRLEELCARAERCTYEVRQKLYAWKIAPHDADAIVRSLTERRFVDDARYAAAFVRDRYRFARWGRRKIALALRQKRIDADIIADALGAIDPDEYAAILRHLLATKLKGIGDVNGTSEGIWGGGIPASAPYESCRQSDYALRTKLYNYAAARGYEPALIAQILRELI